MEGEETKQNGGFSLVSELAIDKVDLFATVCLFGFPIFNFTLRILKVSIVALVLKLQLAHMSHGWTIHSSNVGVWRTQECGDFPKLTR